MTEPERESIQNKILWLIDQGITTQKEMAACIFGDTEPKSRDRIMRAVQRLTDKCDIESRKRKYFGLYYVRCKNGTR